MFCVNLGCSGEIGVSAFHQILSDPRIQDIPLILETPNFEQPEIWAKEIEALNSLSTREEPITEVDAPDVLSGIQALVKQHGGAAQAKKAAKPKAATKGRKKGKKAEEDHETEDEDGHEH